MGSDLQNDLRALDGLPLDQLRIRWRARLKSDAPSHASRDLLVRAYAYALQARAHSALPRESRRRLDDLAERFEADRAYRPSATTAPKAGSVYVREWNGRKYAVTATENGFLLDGEIHPSLSAVAFAITGTKWSGPRFFREAAEDRP